jgi:hypothetical protein
MATSVPNRFVPTDNRSAAKVMENFDYITNRLDLIEAWFSSTGPFVLVSSLTVPDSVTISGSTFSQLSLRDTGAGVNLKRSKLDNRDGVTSLFSPNDADSAILKYGFVFNHSTGVVDFPNGLTQGGANLASQFDSRAKLFVAGEETRDSGVSGTGYGTLATADQITGIVVPANALLYISFTALWKESVANAARASIFIGVNQLTYPAAAANTVEAGITSNVYTPPKYSRLLTHSMGLGTRFTNSDMSSLSANGSAVGNKELWYSTGGGALVFSENNTPVGPWCVVDGLAAGTYTVSIQYKCSSGTVSAKERRLRTKVELY